jgi:hypothetical protein
MKRRCRCFWAVCCWACWAAAGCCAAGSPGAAASAAWSDGPVPPSAVAGSAASAPAAAGDSAAVSGVVEVDGTMLQAYIRLGRSCTYLASRGGWHTACVDLYGQRFRCEHASCIKRHRTLHAATMYASATWPPACLQSFYFVQWSRGQAVLA